MKQRSSDQQERNENGAALKHGNEDGPSFFAGALKQHAAERRGGKRDQADAGIAQCLRADPDDVSVFPEEHDDLFRVEQAKDAYGSEQACGQREGEIWCFWPRATERTATAKS